MTTPREATEERCGGCGMRLPNHADECPTVAGPGSSLLVPEQPQEGERRALGRIRAWASHYKDEARSQQRNTMKLIFDEAEAALATPSNPDANPDAPLFRMPQLDPTLREPLLVDFAGDAPEHERHVTGDAVEHTRSQEGAAMKLARYEAVRKEVGMDGTPVERIRFRTIWNAALVAPSNPSEAGLSDEALAMIGLERIDKAGPFTKVNVRAASNPSSGVELIAVERERQVNRLGWTDEHDDEHVSGELAEAACFYALARRVRKMPGSVRPAWPFTGPAPMPADPVVELTRAGALIAAEIDRLQRLQPQPQEGT